ncbi:MULTISPECIES: transcription antitermination factor NusB [Rossellomorea]|jgi:transcription antitermination protein NusB|uniref:Transcription antitermination protein NusB n=1 Tax=Rossellomorea aquimaris TaxID=189382 RepID=A0A5D4UH72_9BACI|nr:MULTISPECIES: transcription antitermination factor NusB [Rossellomorea]MDT9024815.1 transcription antitermination factor NusB [Rossellomorea sp. YC4-1]TYS77545.1 transcription antitermination factor NusB [Rossellomorea aquimaris]TYS86726.1 transcription antitermination factor NusB [Rossellomorea aquimaris]TYS87524.1 transcription antitermination factor NusB [Rossellomorea aquimaris]
MKRRVAREKALQALFQIDMSGIEPDVALTNVLEEEEKMDAYLQQLVLGFIENQERIDGHIRENLEKWSFDRLAKVDRNILRLGVYELLFVEDVPNKVVINEAVEIAKIFGDDQSSKFINGVLSKVSQS